MSNVEERILDAGYEDVVIFSNIEWIEYNTIRGLPYGGDKAPIIMYRLYE